LFASPARLFRERLTLGAPRGETVRIDVAGIGPLAITGDPATDPFIFGRLQGGAMFEPHILAALAALITPGATFVDVGANIGLFAICGSRLAGPTGRLVAIEPDPANLRLLRHNLRQNGVRRAQLHACAAGDSAGSAMLCRSAENAGDHRVGSQSQRADLVAVRTDRLDRLVPPGGIAPLVVKIDVQGSEPLVLRGMEGLHDRGAPLRLVAEYWPFGLLDCGGAAEDFVAPLARRFDRFWALWQHCPPVPATPDDLLHMAHTNIAPATRMFTDIVALQATDSAGIAAMNTLSSMNTLATPAG
jgi:FkbM family methyltransferase